MILIANKRLAIVLALGLVLVLTASCVSADSTEMAPMEQTYTPTVEASPTETAMPTQTPLPSETPTPTLTPTPTPIPLEAITTLNANRVTEIASLRYQSPYVLWHPEGDGVLIYEETSGSTSMQMHLQYFDGLSFLSSSEANLRWQDEASSYVQMWSSRRFDGPFNYYSIYREIDISSNFIALGLGRTHSILLRDIQDGSFAGQFSQYGLECGKDVTLSFDGSRLASICSVDDDNTLLNVWDVSSQEMIASIPNISNWGIEFDLSPDGEWLAYLSRNGGGLRNLSEDRNALTLSGRLVRFSPDGTTLAVANNSTVTFWDLEQLRVITTLPGVPPYAHHMVFSSDGTRLAIRNGPASVRIYDLTTNQMITEVTPIDGVSDYAMNPDGTVLVVGGYEGLVSIWDIETGEDLITLSHSPQSQVNLELHPGGLALATWLNRNDSFNQIPEVHFWGVTP